MSNTKPEALKNSTAKVVIIGAGAGGITCSIFLKQKLGFTNFTAWIYLYCAPDDDGNHHSCNRSTKKRLGLAEPGEIIFTQWGCASDVGVAFYSLSTDLHDWKSSHAENKDLKEYWENLTTKYHLHPHLTFNTEVSSANWDNEAQQYNISLRNVVTGEETKATAEVLISAIGVLENPRYIDIPGVGDFQGKIFHSARWDQSVELRGKRVGVVGNGASATQFVPLITKDETVRVVQFCRTANWFFPNLVHRYSDIRRWFRRNLPLFGRIERLGHFIRHEFLYWAVFSNSITRRILQKAASKYILWMAPKEYHGKLLPEFGLGCKRIVFDTNYLNSLHRKNLDMNWDGIDRIVQDGILTKKGELIPLDVLIFATGYNADKYHLPIVGSNGVSVQDYYDSQAGAKAYLGTTIPGFPNFFTILGPNTATGHTSVIYTNEIQINYTLKLIKPILERRLPSIEVNEQATDVYNTTIQKRLSQSVFTQCLSWYRVGQEGKITNIFPGSGFRFWMLLRNPNWSHYHTNSTLAHAQTWLKKTQRKQRVVSALVKLAIAFRVVFILVWWKNPALISSIRSLMAQKALVLGSVALANMQKFRSLTSSLLHRTNM
ncbi:hypothetical protein BJ165DRAFT_1534822 [Panaeolus papilionaceus]|nr:hypothetical protein BJ165DRAFT_1534822 [Panaeolus papilionaceus]